MPHMVQAVETATNDNAPLQLENGMLRVTGFLSGTVGTKSVFIELFHTGSPVTTLNYNFSPDTRFAFLGIVVPFNDILATVSIGTAGNPELFMPEQLLSGFEALRHSFPVIANTEQMVIYLNKGASTQGSVNLIISEV